MSVVKRAFVHVLVMSGMSGNLETFPAANDVTPVE
jgi:hypothetical protein